MASIFVWYIGFADDALLFSGLLWRTNNCVVSQSTVGLSFPTITQIINLGINIFAVIFLPVLVLIQTGLTKPIRQFCFMGLCTKVGHFPDGLWLEITIFAGEIHGHFTSKDERQIQLAFERIQLWDDKY